jgi:hypothetical protein
MVVVTCSIFFFLFPEEFCALTSIDSAVMVGLVEDATPHFIPGCSYTAVGETSFKTPFLSEGYGSPFFMTWAPLDSAPPKIT